MQDFALAMAARCITEETKVLIGVWGGSQRAGPVRQLACYSWMYLDTRGE